jgi:hypothetical protein
MVNPFDTAASVVRRRHHAGDLTEEEVLIVARQRELVVHKYRDSHEKLRKLTRRMAKDGKLVMVLFDGRQFYYRTPGSFNENDYA